jgi:cholesterol transport system auxiliary component
MRRRALALVAASSLLTACVSVSVGSTDAPGLTHFVLADARPASVTAPSPGATARLAIQANGSDPLTDSTAIVFSRRTGERALYQFASWTERPSRRLALLAQQRLEARGKFAAVSQLGQPIATDWLLTLAIETLVHDVSTEPGRARLTLRAELIRRSDRSRVAQRVFTAAPAVAEAAAPAAVAAFGTATADVLDQLADWVEATVAAHAVR